MRARSSLTFLLAVVAGGGGCSSSTRTPPVPHAVSPGLVMPSAALRGDGIWPVTAAAWEYGRNDAILNVGATPPIQQRRVVVIKSRDRLFTNNGRPREFSTTFTRSVSYRAVP